MFFEWGQTHNARTLTALLYRLVCRLAMLLNGTTEKSGCVWVEEEIHMPYNEVFEQLAVYVVLLAFTTTMCV